MRVRISVLGFLPIGLATVFVAIFLAACGGGGGGGGGGTNPPLSDNDLITRSAQEASTLTSSATLYISQDFVRYHNLPLQFSDNSRADDKVGNALPLRM